MAAMATTGCGAGAGDRTVSATARAARTTAPPIDRSTSGVDVQLPARVPNEPAARRDVRLTGCSRTAGGWAARGLAAATSGRRDLRLTVYFTDRRSTVLGFARTRVRPSTDAGSRRWTALAPDVHASDLSCVLVGVA